MYSLKGKKILITGGASGIGKIMGRIALEKNAELIIWDVNSEKIKSATDELSAIGKVTGYCVDVSDKNSVSLNANLVKEKHRAIDLLINNAGIVVGKYFYEHSSEDIRRTMAVNAEGPMIVTAEFLPDMLTRNSGYICNIASSAGLVANPKMSVYVASKWAVTGWSESLRIEMRQLKKKIGVTTVTPYYINTGMFDGVKSIIPILKPEKTARRIIRAIENERKILSMPWGIHLVRLAQGFFPIWFFDWLIGKVFGIYNTMDHFKGHQ